LDIFKKAIPSSFAQTGGVARMGFLQSKQAQSSKLQRAHALVETAAQKFKTVPLELLSFNMGVRVKMAQRVKNQDRAQLPILNKLIDDMTSHLTTEGEDDAKHKSYCEAEFEKGEAGVKSAQENLDAKATAIGELKDQIANLADQTKGLEAEIVSLDASVATATLQRKNENAEYTESATMNEAALQLLEKAKQRLNKFYNPVLYKEPPKKELSMEEHLYDAAGRGEWNEAGFVQVRAHKAKTVAVPPPPPAAFDAYAKKGEKSTGVLALIDMIRKDLSNDLKTAEVEEKAADKEYQDMMSTAAKTRAQNAKSITNNEAAQATLEENLTEVKGAKMLTFEQLQKAHELIGTLHQNCDFIMDNFDARKEARTNEIESLKNAKAVLAGASFS